MSFGRGHRKYSFMNEIVLARRYADYSPERLGEIHEKAWLRALIKSFSE